MVLIRIILQLSKNIRKFTKMIFIGLLSIMLINSCALFSIKENNINVLPLSEINNQFQPKIIWSRVLRDSSIFYSNLTPTKLNNIIFIANRYGIVKALNSKNGKEIWSHNLSIHRNFFLRNSSAKLSGGLAATDSVIYIGSERAKLYALNINNGNLIWEIEVAGEALSTPVVSNGIVLIHTSNGILQAFNETTGSLRWAVNLDMSLFTLRGEAAPAIALDVAIIGGDNGRVSAIIVNNGQLIWQQNISELSNANEISRINDIQAMPVIANNIVYAIAYNGNLVALSLYSGEVIWSCKIGSIHDLLINKERIYLVDQNDRVIAVNNKNGIIIWCQDKLLNHNLTSPVLFHNYIIVGDIEGYLYWIDIYNGQFITRKRVDSAGILVKPIIVSNMLIVQARNGKIFAITC